MEQGQQFSHLIYEYFYLRFRFGYYRYGDFLPPIDTFCREFRVAPQTVKAALRRLRDEGYIDMGRGRMTRVLFHQSEQELHSFAGDFYSKRWNAFEDLYISAGLIFSPLLTEGLRRMSGEELDVLSKLAEQSGEDDLFHFYCLIMQKLENPLAMNFFWETSLFQGFPLAKWEYRPTQYSAADIRERMSTLLSYARERRWDCVQDSLIRFRYTDLERITAYLERWIRPCPKEDQLPYVWRIYRDRPQICCTLASRILHDIYMCEYRDHSYLPSYAELAGKYGVSVNTIRRTIGILNRLGAVQSINGKGTLIFPLGARCNRPDFADPIIRRNLAFFVQSFELVRFTCEGATRALLADLTTEEREKLVLRLEQHLRFGRCDVSLWQLLLTIAQCSRLQVVREFYKTAYSLFLWGYPLKAWKEKIPKLDRVMVAFTEDMIRHLREDDAEQCAAVIKNLLAEKLGMTESFLLSQGILSEELWLSRSIRLPIAEGGLPHQAG